jgi:hypothetical protein
MTYSLKNCRVKVSKGGEKIEKGDLKIRLKLISKELIRLPIKIINLYS